MSVSLPDSGIDATDDVLGWLLGEMSRPDDVFSSPLASMVRGQGDALAIGVGGREWRIALAGNGDAGRVTVMPGLSLVPPDPLTLTTFLRSHWRQLDHIGINLSTRELSVDGWQALIGAVATVLPAYRLDVGSLNDIVMIVDDRDPARMGVVELVHDHVAPSSSFHICASVNAGRAALEAAFPFPFGGYKPGDEAFFRSVALPVAVAMPVYLDLAFADGGMMPWPDIVAAMGTRIH